MAQMYAEEGGVSVGEAERRMAVIDEARELQVKLSETCPEQFGGLYFDHELGVVAVAWTEDTVMLASLLPQSDYLILQVQFSKSELASALEGASADLESQGVPADVSVDVRSNSVTVEVTWDGLQQAEDALVSTISQDPVLAMLPDSTAARLFDVQVIEALAQPEAAIYGGLPARTCTWGLPAYNAFGQRRMLTAGHCDNTQTIFGKNTVFRAEVFDGPYDVQVHEVMPSTGYKVAPFVADGSEDPYTPGYRYLTGTRDRSEMVIDELVCKYGRVTRLTCGRISRVDYRPSYVPNATATYVRVHSSDDLSRPGDSGGPWFAGGIAYGIHSGGFQDFLWIEGNDAIFMPVNYISDLGLSVLLRSSPPPPTDPDDPSDPDVPPPPPPPLPPPPPAPPTGSGVRGDFNGDGDVDLVGRLGVDATLWFYPGDGSGGFETPVQIGQGWSGFNALVSPGDFDGDDRSDLIGRMTDGTLWLYRGTGEGGFGSGEQIGQGWSDFTSIVGPGDFSGDGNADLIGRNTAGRLLLYRGDGSGGFYSGNTEIGHGWAGFTSIVAPGDFSGDGRPDLIARTSDGRLYLYRGNGSGGFNSGSTQIGSGWNIFDLIIAPGDFSGDGRNDLIGRKPDGTLWLYRGNGSGGFTSPYPQIGHGWAGFAAIV